MPSIFTKIIQGEIPCYKVAENDSFLAFLDISPLQKGHTLIVPKKEIDYIFDMDNDLLAEMIVFAKDGLTSRDFLPPPCRLVLQTYVQK